MNFVRLRARSHSATDGNAEDTDAQGADAAAQAGWAMWRRCARPVEPPQAEL